jgi:DNA gyrase/topoisomerase IV subunit B
LAVPDAVPNPMDVELNAHQAALAGFSHHLEVNITKADNVTVVQNSRAMAGTYADQSQTVAKRAQQFLGQASQR